MASGPQAELQARVNLRLKSGRAINPGTARSYDANEKLTEGPIS
jgi:hypothetical protein